MKKIFPLSLALLLLSPALCSQIPEIKGKPIVEIFTDFHINLDDTAKTTGFGLGRAYLGYTFLPGNDFSATIILNIGSPEDLTPDALHRRYAYFREASISYFKDRLNISFGMVSTKHYAYEQKFWGKRYIANTFQALNGYGIVADLGVVAEYKFSDVISADISVLNGEGYSDLQLDNGVKTSAGLTFTPSARFAFRFYNDITKQYGVWQYTLLTFAGFRNDHLTIGADYNYKTNLDLRNGDNGWGISGTAAYSISKKYEFFARYDYSSSVSGIEYADQWNFLVDNSLIIAGLQYTFNPNVRMALNYQENIPYYADLPSTGLIFLSASFRIGR
jgi:hypothetical protein